MAGGVLPERGKGSKGPARPGQVYWIEEDGDTYLAVVVRVGGPGNDLMTVYGYDWPGEPPADLASIDPDLRSTTSIVWKASRSRGRWTRLGTIPDFDPANWPLDPMRHPLSGDLVIPHPDDPGAVIEQRRVPASETDGLARYAFGGTGPLVHEIRSRTSRGA